MKWKRSIAIINGTNELFAYAWLSAARLKIDAAVGYYGGKIVQFLDQKPLAPLILHFGKEDRSIPLTDVQKIEHAYPDTPIYLYEASHAFNRKSGQNYSQAAAEQSRARSLKFLCDHLQPQLGRKLLARNHTPKPSPDRRGQPAILS
jgi:hypothetical protein